MTDKDDLFTYEEVSRLAKRMEEELVDTREELDKYKRAFEIFKRFVVEEGNYADLEFGVFDGTVDISDEETELLEELLKG